ncbi:hypothetical protein IGI04_007271, partial [Brassica rapa subsp. trilocularis]
KKNVCFRRASIDNMTDTSSDTSVEESIYAELLEAIDTAQPEAGKSLLTNLNNEEVVLGEPKGPTCNANNQIINKQGTAVSDKIYITQTNEKEQKLLLQDYLNLGRTYSNRSAIRLPESNIGRSEFNLDFLILPGSEPSPKRGRSNQTRGFEEPRPDLDDQEGESDDDEEIDRQTRDHVDQQTQDNADRQTSDSVDRQSLANTSKPIAPTDR